MTERILALLRDPRLASDVPADDAPALLAELAALLPAAGAVQDALLIRAMGRQPLDTGLNHRLKSRRDQQRGPEDPHGNAALADGVREARGSDIRDGEPMGDGTQERSGAIGAPHAALVLAKAQANAPMSFRETAAYLDRSLSYVQAVVRQGKLRAFPLPGTDKGGEFPKKRKGRGQVIFPSDIRTMLEKEALNGGP